MRYTHWILRHHMPWQFYLCFASFPRLILIGAKWLEKCGAGLHNEDFGEHVLLTGGDAEHHPSYNIQPPNSMTSISYISKCLFFVVCLYL